MKTDMNIKIDGIEFQRNGIGGQSFYQVFFRYSEKGMEERKLIGVLTGNKTYCFVIDPSDIQNHWRGDNFERELRDAIINHYAKKHDCSYTDQCIRMNEEEDKPGAW